MVLCDIIERSVQYNFILIAKKKFLIIINSIYCVILRATDFFV
jgi:hypothetical protein